jgi:uncharacterized protein YbjT (DUF2867 family)
MKNASWDVAPAAKNGVIPSFLERFDEPVPIVVTSDIGRVAAELMQSTWSGRDVVELEGPHRVTPDRIAATFAELLGRPDYGATRKAGEWEWISLWWARRREKGHSAYDIGIGRDRRWREAPGVVPGNSLVARKLLLHEFLNPERPT